MIGKMIMVLATAKKLGKLYEKIYLAIVYVVGSKSKLFQRIANF